MKKRLAIYLTVTFGLAWGLLVPAGIVLGTFENGESSSTTMIGLIAVSMFFPLVGALVANAASAPEDRIDLAWRPLVEQNVRHYLVAWLLPAAIVLLGCVVFYALNPQWFDPTMRSYVESVAAATGQSADQLLARQPPLPAAVASTVLSALAVAPFINTIPAFGEELGWRGMLFPSLAELMPERSAALVSGAIWGIWHAPVIAMGHNYGMGYEGFPLLGILTMVLTCTAMACWLSYLRSRSGSVWPCALAHGSFNAVANLGLMFCTCGSTPLGPSPLGLVAGIPLMVIGAVCWTRLDREGTAGEARSI